ncbi:carbohydrate ABC transporter permease [Paenibacillus sp. GCM10023248]|uniref:carbohydrate ABC transporter permease n=1 Tax=Bacillales TaxID=1385 RepID=UPI002377DD0F|nr:MULTISPECIES: sugar ABC transporter permease [Bacillales]MDD9267119.1 sugar ABC transporter permease [Paenibacillus sp. MAHUQ-63]MDR6881337.1 multiple sugar transport system permease protein [Bacillus sp. 3255]
MELGMETVRRKEKRRGWNQQRKEAVIGWIFLAPEAVGIVTLAIFPLLFSLFLSFTNWNLAGGFEEMDWVGFANFEKMVDDTKFWKALEHNLFFTAVTVPMGLLIAMIMAVLIHTKVYAKDLFKILFFIPYICSTVAIAAVWAALYHPSSGPINQFLMAIGMEHPPKWLVDSQYALIAIMVIAIWQALGYQMIIFLAGLTQISEDIYESARIDGASGSQQFWYITVPLLAPTTLFLTITTIIGSFKVFDLIKFLTDGGPNDASTVLVYRIYEEGFINFNMGYASALSWVLFLLVIAVTSVTWVVQAREKRS